MKLPNDTIEKIRERQLDMGQIVYDIVERNLNPYKNEESIDNDIGITLLSKLVTLMVDHNVTAPKGFFTATEEVALRGVPMGELE